MTRLTKFRRASSQSRGHICTLQEPGNLCLTSSQPALPSQDGWLSTFSTALALKNKEVRPCRANAVHVVGSLLVPQRGDDSARKAPAPKLRRKWAPRWPECLLAAAASCKKETLLLMKSNEGEGMVATWAGVLVDEKRTSAQQLMGSTALQMCCKMKQVH